MSAYERSAPSDFGSNLSSSLTSTLRFLRSVSKSSLSPARCTLTATGDPLYTARCTCPSDAAAIGSVSNESKTSSTGLPSSCAMIALAFSPPKPGTLSCRSLSTSVYSFSSRSSRVETTCPSLTNVGPSWKSPSRINSAASVFCALISSSVRSLPFRALTILRPHLPRKPKVSSVRLNAEPCALLSQPSSIRSPALDWSAGPSPTTSLPGNEKRTARRMELLSRLIAPFLASSSVQISGSSTSHASSSRAAASVSTAFFMRMSIHTPLNAPTTRSRLRCTLGGAVVVTKGASSCAACAAALTDSNSSSSDAVSALTSTAMRAGGAPRAGPSARCTGADGVNDSESAAAPAMQSMQIQCSGLLGSTHSHGTLIMLFFHYARAVFCASVIDG